MAAIASEVKVEVLEKVKNGEKVSQLALQYGINAKTIYRWLKGNIDQEISYREYKRVLKENEDLKKVLGVLTFELEKTKKKNSTK